MEIKKELDERTKRELEFLTNAMKWASQQAFWLGLFTGLVFGIALGYIIGAGLGSDTVLVLPLGQGVEV